MNLITASQQFRSSRVLIADGGGDDNLAIEVLGEKTVPVGIFHSVVDTAPISRLSLPPLQAQDAQKGRPRRSFGSGVAGF
jgi:hypothetical protein